MTYPNNATLAAKLLAAIRGEEVLKIDKILAKGLWRAVKLQRATAVKHLLKRGANWRIPGPDYRDLLFACLCYRQTKNEKKDAVFNILIAHGVVFQQKVVQLMYDGKIEEAKRQAITDEDYRCVMLFGCILGDIPLIQWAFDRHASSRMALESARYGILIGARRGHIPVMQWCISMAKVTLQECDEDQNTPLLLACACGHLDAVKWLVQEGASVTNERTSFMNTALLKASFNGHFDIVRWLLEEGGSSAQESNHSGMTALLFAAYHGYIDMARYLLTKGGSSITEKDNSDNTALIWAAYNGQLEMVKFLVQEAGAKVTEVDKIGRPVVSVGAMTGHLPVLQWLIEQGGADTPEMLLGATNMAVVWYRNHQNLETVRWLLEKTLKVRNMMEPEVLDVLNSAFRLRREQIDLCQLVVSFNLHACTK